MAIVAGVDFGTLSVRVSIVDSERGLLATALAEYPLHRKREDPEYATQSHDDQMRALASATREAIGKAQISGDRVQALAVDTTGSSVIPVGKNLQPLDEYYLWCDHRAKAEAAEITEAAHREGLQPFSGAAECIRRSGVFRSCCIGCATIRRSVPNSIPRFEHCDMAAATLCGITDARKVKRSVCAMGHKWLWNPRIGRSAFGRISRQSRSLVCGRERKTPGRICDFGSNRRAGFPPFWAEKLGLKAGIPDTGRSV